MNEKIEAIVEKWHEWHNNEIRLSDPCPYEAMHAAVTEAWQAASEMEREACLRVVGSRTFPVELERASHAMQVANGKLREAAAAIRQRGQKEESGE